MARNKKGFAVIGLGDFGRSVLDALLRREAHVVAIDRSEAKVQAVKDRVTMALRADVVDERVLEEVFPEGVHCAVVGLGDQEHAATLVTHHLAKMKVPEIVVEATDQEHAEILQIVGATRVVNPNEEAAERIVGLLAGRDMLDYFAVSDDFSLIEIRVLPEWVGKSVAALELDPERVQVVAVRHPAGPDDRDADWHFVARREPLQATDVVLVAGTRESLDRLTG